MEKQKNIPFEQLLTEHKAEIDWLIKDWIEEETIVFIYGRKFSYKTYVALTFMYLCHLGKPLDTHKTKYGKNILYAVTEGRNTMRNRYEAMKQFYGQNNNPNSETRFHVYSDDWSWDEAYIDDFVNKYKSFDVFVFDCLSQSLGGDSLNNDSTARKVYRGLNKIKNEMKATVIVIHHTGKNPTKGMMGSAVPGNHADTEIKVDGSKKTITLLKQRNGSLDNMKLGFMPLPIYLGKDSDDESILNLAIDLDQKKKGLDYHKRMILTALEAFEAKKVLKKEVKDATEKLLYPSGIPEKEKDSYRAMFNRKAERLEEANLLFIKEIKGKDYYSERPFEEST